MAANTPLNPNSFPYYPSSTTSNLFFHNYYYYYSPNYQQPSEYMCYTNPLLAVPSSPYAVVTTPPPNYNHHYCDFLLHHHNHWWPSATVVTTATNGCPTPDAHFGRSMNTLVEEQRADGCNLGVLEMHNIGKYSPPSCCYYVPAAEAAWKNNKNKNRRSSSSSIWTKKGSFPRQIGDSASGPDLNKCCSSYPKLRCFRKKSSIDKTSPEEYDFRADLAAVGNTINGGGGGGGGGGGDGTVSLHGGSRTTVMIKNVPNKYTKEMLLSLVDGHCAEVNQKLRSCSMVYNTNNGGGETESKQNPVIFSEFDFFYLPMDFCSGSNLGYAFVNFTSPVGAWRLYQALHDKCWPFVPSRKICQVTFARIQGLRALKKNFENSKFNCKSYDLLPVVFHPPRNGTNFLVKGRYIGSRVESKTFDS